jgi:hypothetical protein
MARIASVTLTALVALVPFAAHADRTFWSELDVSRVPMIAERFTPATKGRTLALQHAALVTKLSGAPSEAVTRVPESSFTIELPLPDGSFDTFRVVETAVMAPELAARYPQIKTYLAQSTSDPGVTARLDTTTLGFRAQFLSSKGTAYIEPLARGDIGRYIVFNKADDTSERPPMRCNVTGEVFKSTPEGLRKNAIEPLATGANLRTYRLAVATTGEYAASFGGAKADALGGIVTTMNRVNGIFEREAAVRMQLIANNDLVIFTNGATDPYDNNDSFAMLSQNQSTLTSIIGGANYDIGHVFTTGGGGVATLGSVCSASAKGRGVTGLPTPRGDWFDVDFVSHEIGHQFNAPHTFNSQSNNCGNNNRSGGSAYEPGSGSTIMSYTGSCSPHNLQSDSDDHFHGGTLNTIHAFVAGGGSICGLLTSTGNAPPTISAPANNTAYTIPSRTPFMLTATAADANNDTLTYNWEQLNTGDANVVNDPLTFFDTGNNPIFRTFAPSLSPTRFFPSLRYILDNANIPPVNAPLLGTTSPSFFTGETLPTTNRTLNFQLMVRDNRPGGGGTEKVAVNVNVNAASGPFAVTSPNTNVSWAAGTNQTVTWNVANTSGAPVSASNVQIALSTDGGFTFPTILAASVPNNGSANITIPANTPSTTRARIRVMAVGNIFFDISDTNFTITGTNTVPTITATGTVTVSQGGPSATAVVATVSDAQDAAGSLTVSVAKVPQELNVTLANNSGNVSLTATAACSLYAPRTGTSTYPVLLRVTDSAGAQSTAYVNVLVSANSVPTLGTYSNVIIVRGTTVSVNPSSAPADGNNNANAPTVSVNNLSGSGPSGSVSVAANGNVSIVTTATTDIASFPIRVSVADSCGATRIRDFTARVLPPGAYLDPAGSQLITGNALIEPNECNELSFSVTNVGNSTATAVGGTLSSSTPGVSITRPSATFPDVGTGQTRTTIVPFQFSTTNSLACGSAANFNITVNYAGGNSPLSLPLSFLVGTPIDLFTQNFDGVTAPALPAGWTTAQSGTPPAVWASSTASPFSAPNAVFTNGVATVASNDLISPSIALPASNTGASIEFAHTWNFEAGYDGGVLEISTNGGSTYNDVTSPTIGGTFESGGYSGSVDPNFGNPIAGRTAWTGTQAAYITSVLRLPATLNGQTIRLRFRGGWDSEVANSGVNWRIDNIVVRSGLQCPGPGAGVCAAASYAIGGTVSGLTGTGLVLQNNGGNNLAVNANGSFTFTTPVASGSPYNVTVLTQPSGQACTVSDGSGTVGSAPITSVAVTCSSGPFPISTTASPAASGTLSCSPNPVAFGGSSTCTATPALGFAFGNWSGDCTGSNCSLSNVVGPRSVTANFVALPLLNIDNSAAPTVYEAATDGLLLMRYLLGLRGAELVAGALGTNPLRNATQIETHIQTYLSRFDVDGDGVVRPHTDGLMIYRRLQGLANAALTNGAKNSARSDADVAAAIDALRP